MKYIRQWIIILFFCFLGEELARLLPLPVPASIYGLLLLFAALALGIVPLKSLEKTADFLLSIMPVLFIAPAIRILDVWDMVQPLIVPIAIIVVVSTLACFTVSGSVSRKMMKTKDDEQ